ncbi:wax ester/triacylglycerol synthase family O-acyltransferase [Nocardia mangyaensis]|uniref:wax ester/triacylglycerol synthase family O-acyltransferase n=1 Tax=Nocardia mangyaensis TaxID=2213200 RepID=UPI002675F6E2|nr:wax ester/triacylglycerol synthase family O-acyltransferase [Nocardia mangyaensis]MDO3647709.1 wax ester/triacylglycerol synthase family O-acyltransferase [Nocardia mangyaensis]
MSELHPLDGGFMELEDTDRHISLGIGATAIMAGPAPNRSEFVEWLRERIDRVERLRERVRSSRWDLTAPVWEADPHFDLAHHIRWTALPEPNDESTLCEVIAAELAERLDRDHPLWQCVVVEHLAGDRWALIVKAHHAMVDGISGITLFERLCEPVDDDPVPVAAPKTRVPGAGRFDLAAKVVRLPVTAPRFAMAMARGLVPVVYAAVAASGSSSLNGPIGRQRRYVVGRASLAEVREIGAAFSASVNDVALAAITSAYRALLVRRGEDPAVERLRVLIPVSVRPSTADYVMDNRVSAIIPHLPVEVRDPVERLTAVHARVTHHRARGEAEAERSMLAVAESLPYAVVAWAFRLAGHFPQRSVAALATNVPGPRRQLTLNRRPVLEILPCIPIAMRLRTTIAILSYQERLVFGITGDYDTTPDIDLLAEGIESAISELLALARGRREDRPVDPVG